MRHARRTRPHRRPITLAKRFNCFITVSSVVLRLYYCFVTVELFHYGCTTVLLRFYDIMKQ